MRVLAGFGQDPACYHVKRAAVNPSAALLERIFPWLERAKSTVRNGPMGATGLTSLNFINLFEKLRSVLLQDAAVLQPAFPDLPLWNHPVFAAEEWLSFSQRVQACEEVNEEPEDAAVRMAVPVVADALRAHSERVSTMIAETNAAVGQVGDEMQHVWAELSTIKGEVAVIGARLTSLEQACRRRDAPPQVLVSVHDPRTSEPANPGHDEPSDESPLFSSGANTRFSGDAAGASTGTVDGASGLVDGSLAAAAAATTVPDHHDPTPTTSAISSRRLS